MEYSNFFYSCGVKKSIVINVNEQSVDQKHPIILLCHGHSRHKNDGLDILSETLVEHGFCTARFDFRGCSSLDPDRYELYCATQWPEDLENAISYVSTIPCVDKNRIGVAGISMGASTAVYVSGIDSRIKSTVSMAGIGNCYEWMKGVWSRNEGDFPYFLRILEKDKEISAATGKSRLIHTLEMYHSSEEEKKNLQLDSFLNNDINAFVSLASLRNMMSYRPIEKCSSIHHPIFFAHGEKDELVPFDESLQMYQAASSAVKKIKSYEGIEHNIPMDPNRQIVFDDISKWFLETL
ncbi:alpha/beta hydrolase [uncultured Robinsoniella sp.]|uniref:alpha/beta hydrolase n=1 Tax=uncultured Robinsoniella sp. TaxID=904190 RepID=UPI00374E5136